MKKRLIALTLLLAITLTGCNKHADLRTTIAHEENKTSEVVTNEKPVTPTEEPTAAPSTEGTSEAPTEGTTEDGNIEQPTTEWASENGTSEQPTGGVAEENMTSQNATTENQTTSHVPPTTASTTQSTTKATQAPTQKPTQAPTVKPTQAPTQKPTEQQTTVAFDENKAREAVLKAYSDARRDLKGWGPVTLDAEKSFDRTNVAQGYANTTNYQMAIGADVSGRLAEMMAYGSCLGKICDYDVIYDVIYNRLINGEYSIVSSEYQVFFYEEINTVGIDIGRDSLGNYYIGFDGSDVSYDIAVQANYDGVKDYRATLGYQPFEYNEKLMKQAQEWADMLAANPEWYDDNTKVHSSMHEGVQEIPCYETVSLCGGSASSYYSNAYCMYTHSAAFKFDDTMGYQMGFGVAVDKNGRSYVVMQMSNSYKLSQ